MKSYTIQEFTDLHIDNSALYILPSNISSALKALSLEIGIPAIIDEPVSQTNNQRKYTDRHNDNRQMKSANNNNNRRQQVKNAAPSSSENWETIRNFKTTKMEVKAGVEKQIDEIRVCLNKISTKNYDTQKVAILQKINDSIRTDDMDSRENMVRIATAIFEIASSNKFYSEIYADLYYELITQHAIFSEIINDVVMKYNISIDNIKYVDPNVDYDGFCSFTKTNDSRRAMAIFIVNLMIKGVLEQNVITDIIIRLQDLVFKYADEDGRSNELDEINENIFLFMVQCKNFVTGEQPWIIILENNNKLSQYKAKDHKSFTSRSMFKYMDIIKQ